MKGTVLDFIGNPVMMLIVGTLVIILLSVIYITYSQGTMDSFMGFFGRLIPK